MIDDFELDEMIAASSLGTTAANSLRARSPKELVEVVIQRTIIDGEPKILWYTGVVARSGVTSGEETTDGKEVRAMANKQGRSAITGRFVKQSTVKRHPKTTVNESKGNSKK